MAENLQKRPSKGILKNSSSFDQQDAQQHHRKSINKETKWDEMNIIATLHPPDKDYGHMKIDEPKTPYNYDEADSSKDLDSDALLEKLKNERPPKVMEESDDDDDQEEEEDLTPEEKALRKEFEMKRKAHYNEYYAVKLARKLLEEDNEEDDEKEEEETVGVAGKCDAGTSGFVNQCLCDEECKCILAENKNCK